jgi:hypothetical protein
LKEYRRIESQLNRSRGRGISPRHFDLPAFCATFADSLSHPMNTRKWERGIISMPAIILDGIVAQQPSGG